MPLPRESSKPTSAACGSAASSPSTGSADGTSRHVEHVRAFYEADPEREWQRTASSPYHRLEFDLVHQHILADRLAPGSHILDLGSGPGRHALALAARGHRLTLVDLSAAALDFAAGQFRAAGLGGRLVATREGDATKVALPPAGYDAVLVFGPLYHLLDDADARECLRRAAAALRPGGRLFAIFLTRTSVVRDLLKRGRFSEIEKLLADGYLEHGQYVPLTPESRQDYMPPARTHTLEQARALLTGAGLEVTGVHSLEGAAAWMRPYVDRVAADEDAFGRLAGIVAATSVLPELVEAGDHFLLSARKPDRTAREAGPTAPEADRADRTDRADRADRAHRSGRIGPALATLGPLAGGRRVLVTAADRISFAPAAAVHQGRRFLVHADGAAADRRYLPAQHAHRPREAWYQGGRNRLRMLRFPAGEIAGEIAGGTTAGAADLLDPPLPHGATDVTGAALAGQGELLHLWFGARRGDGGWAIHHCTSGDSGTTWTEPAEVLTPGPPGSSDSEHVLLPSVLRREGQWWMWYAGRDGSHRRVHLARSADGVRWTRHGVALGLGEPGAWDAYAADCPAVTALADGTLLMVYGAGTSRSLAAAVSADGRTWRRLGPLLHRGPSGAPDSRYAFYPALLSGAGGTVELLYAGESDEGHWSVLTAGPVDTSRLSERPAPLDVPPGLDATVAALRTEVPEEFRRTTDDAHGKAPAFVSADGLITQLRPSSTAVFRVREAPGATAHVVKLGRGRAFSEREFDGIHALAAYLPVPRATLRYQGDDAAVVLEHLPGRSLATLAGSAPERFLAVLGDYAARTALTAALGRPAAAGDAAGTAQDHTLRTPQVVAAWLDDLGGRLADLSGLPLVLDGRPLRLTLGAVLEDARRVTRQPASWLAASSGDLHLRNVHAATDSDRWWLLDFEFAGMHDLDHLVATLLGSCLKHANLVAAPRARVHRGELHISGTPAGPAGAVVLGSTWLLDHFAATPIDRARVLGFLVADLYWRLTDRPDGTGLPEPGLAALALGIRLAAGESV